MAIAFRASTNLSAATRTNTTGSAPAGFTTGDVLVAIHSVGESTAPTVTGPSGWTKVAEVTFSRSDPWTTRYSMWVASYGVSDYTWVHSSGWSLVQIAAYSGVDNTTSMDVTPSTNFVAENIGEGLTAVASSITTVTANTMLIIGRGSWDGNAISPPSGWTERVDDGHWLGEKAQSSTGATGDVSLDSGNSSANPPWGTIFAALRPDLGQAVSPTGASATVSPGTLTVTGATVPSAVSDLAGTAGNAQVVLTWSAPSNGGSAITDYIVEYREA